MKLRASPLGVVAALTFLPSGIVPGCGSSSETSRPVDCGVIIGFPNDTTPPVTDRSGPYDLVDTWSTLTQIWATCNGRWRFMKIDTHNAGPVTGPTVTVYVGWPPDSFTRRGTYTWYGNLWADGITRADWVAAHLVPQRVG